MVGSESLHRLAEFEGLREPVLVASFVRKNGVNTTAAASLAHRIRVHDLEAVAEFDPQPFFDFTQTRPQVRMEGEERAIEWPQNRVHLERSGEGGRDALIVSGMEPHLHWRGFSELLGEFAKAHGVRTAVVLRSFPATVPHTRPVLLRLTTSSEQLATEIGLPRQQPDYEGPIDIGGVLVADFEAGGGAGAGVTALVPNYLGVVPNPMAVLGLTQMIDRLLRTHTEPGDFEEAAASVRSQADEQMEQSAEVRDAVRSMEEQYESMAGASAEPAPEEDASELPSAEDLLSDVERFLSNDGDDS